MLRNPNKAVAAYARQSGGFADLVDLLAAAVTGDGVLTGMGVAAQGSPDMTVAVAAGQTRIGGYFAAYAGANVSIAAADSTNPRFDIIVCDWNGNVSRVGGTPAAYPVPPDIPANSIELAQLYVPAGATSIDNPKIVDKRPVPVDFYDTDAEFLGSSLSATAATSAGSVGECGWTLSASGTLAAPVFVSATSGHIGVLQTVTGATSGNNTRAHYGNSATSVMFIPTDIARMRFLVAVPTITSVAVKLGFGVDLSDAASSSLGTAGAFIEFVPATSAKWAFVTRQASASTRNVDTGADVVAGSWYDFTIIRKQNGDWQFLKNGTLMFTHSSNQPSTGGNVGTLVHTLTTAARTLNHDFHGMNFKPLGNRYS